MARHSKWAQIKRKKAILDGKKGAKFTQISRQITLAAKNGGDPSMNPTLALAIQKGKDANMTNDVLQKAIKKGTGELKGEAEVVEMFYEGYAPHGVAVLIRTLTDNTNRTVGSLRHIFSKYGGALGNSGSVAFQFQKKGMLVISLKRPLTEDDELVFIENNSEDYEQIDEEVNLYVPVADMHKIKHDLENKGYSITDVKITYIPTTTVTIADQIQLDEIMKVLEYVEDDEDVDEVFTNIHVADHL